MFVTDLNIKTTIDISLRNTLDNNIIPLSLMIDKFTQLLKLMA